MRYQLTLFTFILLVLTILSLYYARKKVTRKLYQSSRKHLKVLSNGHTDLYLNVNTGIHISKLDYQKTTKSRAEYINLWYMCKYPSNKIVIYYHGTNCNISYRKYMLEIGDKLKLNILLVDYRGFGKSEGKANPQNVLNDAEAAYKFISKYHQPQNIYVWGESLGVTPATHVASKYPVAGLIVLSGFTSLHSIIRGNYILYCVARLVTSDIDRDTNNLELIKKVNCPVLIYHSTEDRLINYSNALDLLDAVTHTNKRLVTIRGDHDKPKFTHDNFKEVIKFIGLTNISDKKVDSILDIIDNISEVVHGELTNS